MTRAGWQRAGKLVPEQNQNSIDPAMGYKGQTRVAEREHQFGHQDINKLHRPLAGARDTVQQPKISWEQSPRTNGNRPGYVSAQLPYLRNWEAPWRSLPSNGSRGTAITDPSRLSRSENRNSGDGWQPESLQTTSPPRSPNLPWNRPSNQCMSCRKLNAPGSGELVKCRMCHNLYHPECHDPEQYTEVGRMKNRWICHGCTIVNLGANGESAWKPNAKGEQSEMRPATPKIRATDRPISPFEIPNCNNPVLGSGGTPGSPITLHDSPRQKARHFDYGEKRNTSPVVIDLTGEDDLDIAPSQATKTVPSNAVIAAAPVAPMAVNPGLSAVRRQGASACLPAPFPSIPNPETPQGDQNPGGAAMRSVSTRPMKSELSGPPFPGDLGVSSRSSSPPYSPPPAFPEELFVPPVAVATSLAPNNAPQASLVAPHLKMVSHGKGMAVAEHIFTPRQNPACRPSSEYSVHPTLPETQTSITTAPIPRVLAPSPLLTPTTPNSGSSHDDTMRSTKRAAAAPMEPPPAKRPMRRIDLVMEKYRMQPAAKPSFAAVVEQSSPAATNSIVADVPPSSPISRHPCPERESLPGNAKRKQRQTAEKLTLSKLKTSERFWGNKARHAASTEPPVSVVSSPMSAQCGSTPTSATSKSARKSAPAIRKEPRSGPAMKRAGRLLRSEPDLTDSTESVDAAGLRDSHARLMEKLRLQKDCTKRQSELASRERAKFRGQEEENAELKRQLIEQKDKFNKLLQLASRDGQMLAAIEAIGSSDQAATPPSPCRPFLKKELFADEFCDEAPIEEPSPVPHKQREPGWRKKKYSALDRSRLMKVHLHRERAPVRPPSYRESNVATIQFEPEEPTAVADSWTPIPSVVRYRQAVPKTLDEFFGIPEEPIPVLRDGALGYKSGVINQRSRLPDRNAPCFKMYGPRDLQI